jgi:hypothetical protein
MEQRTYTEGVNQRNWDRQQADEIADEERAAVRAAAAPPNDGVPEILFRFQRGDYGDPNSPEAQALRDADIKKAQTVTSAPGSIGDKKLLIGEQDAYLNTSSSASALKRARDLLNQGIYTGYTGGVRTMWGNAEMPGGDKDLANRTKEYNSIMNAEAIAAMSQALKGATTDTEMARFIEIMNDPTIDPKVKARQIDAMLAKVGAFQQLRAGRIQEWGGEIPNYTDPYAAQPTTTDLPEGVSEEDIQETMRVHGLTREQVLQRLQGG